jgi:DNA-binding response OmpR family regulator
MRIAVNILLCTNHQSIKRLVRKSLGKRFFAISMADSYRRVKQLLHKELFDLVLIDTANRPNAEKKIQQLLAENNTGLPVILLAGREKGKNGIEIGGYVIRKPLNKHRIEAAVKLALKENYASHVVRQYRSIFSEQPNL